MEIRFRNTNHQHISREPPASELESDRERSELRNDHNNVCRYDMSRPASILPERLAPRASQRPSPVWVGTLDGKYFNTNSDTHVFGVDGFASKRGFQICELFGCPAPHLISLHQSTFFIFKHKIKFFTQKFPNNYRNSTDILSYSKTPNCAHNPFQKIST